MSYIESYKKRVGFNDVTNSKLRIIYEARKNFEKSLKKDPCSLTTKITDVGEVNISDTTKLVDCIINDFSNNDQKSFDEKMLYTRYDENIGIGSYVEFDNFVWLITFKEHRSNNAYKVFIMRKCNQILKYNYKGVIYDIPCVVKNLTQYSDGLQDIVYTSTPDSRRSITYANNSITSKLELGHRFLVGNERSYRVTHIQNFEYQDSYKPEKGITTCIAVHTSLRSEDDTENNLAFNDDNSGGTNANEEYMMISSNTTYEIEEQDCTWEIEYLSDKSDYVKISSKNGVCIISIDMDFDLIGETFKVYALNLNNNVIFEKHITVVGFI